MTFFFIVTTFMSNILLAFGIDINKYYYYCDYLLSLLTFSHTFLLSI